MAEQTRTGGAVRGVGQTRAMVLELKLAGRTTREIATLCGISTQAVNQHLQRLKDLGELEGAA